MEVSRVSREFAVTAMPLVGDDHFRSDEKTVAGVRRTVRINVGIKRKKRKVEDIRVDDWDLDRATWVNSLLCR
jgi:4-hydroxy-3-methylbut-2-en-1-yl diphosphate synthase IspG/GcpE